MSAAAAAGAASAEMFGQSGSQNKSWDAISHGKRERRRTSWRRTRRIRVVVLNEASDEIGFVTRNAEASGLEKLLEFRNFHRVVVGHVGR